MSFVSNILLTWYYIYNTEIKLQFFYRFNKQSQCLSQCLLKSHLSCLVSYIYFVLNSAKVKKNGNVTVKNYLNESLFSLLCFIIYGQGSLEKGLM